MSPDDLEHYLHAHIPLSHAMAASVREVSPDAVVLVAPLAPNINHRETVFGGSASALAILAAWSLLHTRLLREHPVPCRVVIQRNTMDYAQPIAGEFLARSSLADPAAWAGFLRLLARRGRARLAVRAVLEHEGRPVGAFEGDFVAIATPPAAGATAGAPSGARA